MRAGNWRMLLGLCVSIWMGFHAVAAAAIHEVPDDFTTITAALAAASPGDTVLVAAGTYSTSSNGETFPLYVDKDSLCLLGAGMGESVIDAESQSTVLWCEGAVGGRVSGFTVTGGWADRGGGIWVRENTPMEVDHNLVQANGATLLAAGIMIDADAWIHHNVVWQNFDTDTLDTKDPHGVRVQRGTSPIFEHNLVGRTDGNGLIVGDTSTPTVRHNIFFENGASTPIRRGRGICWLSSAPLVVYHNLFFNNEVAAMLVPDLGGDFSGEEANDLLPDDDIYGNIDADPLLVDPDNWDFHLSPGSPAIDAGDSSLPYDPDGTIADIGPFYFDQIAGVPSHEDPAEEVFSVVSNPLSADVRLQFVLSEPGRAYLAVYDVHGRQLTVLADRHFPVGEFLAGWDRRDAAGREVGPGVYFARLEAGGLGTTLKIVLLE
jgi:hypothetical protein